MDNKDIARELLKVAKELTSKELLELTETTKGAEHAWPDVTYEGTNVLKLYMAVTNEIEREIKADADMTQEVYLGYIGDGKFISGWDVWGYKGYDNGNLNAYALILLQCKGKRMDIRRVNIVMTEDGGFYDEGYDEVKRKYKPTDLRLD